MIRLALIDQDGKTLLPQDLATAAELHEAAEKAKALIRECERVARLRNPQNAAAGRGTPYLT